MNEKLLSRGKRKDNGEWITGYYVKIPNKANKLNKECHIIFDLDGRIGCIIPETLGSCTGRIDKNGKKIFEGDIVDYNGTKHEVIFETRFSAYFGIKISHIETWQFCLEVPAKLMEVVGNIHDNPELIGGTE